MPDSFVSLIRELEKLFDKQIWMLIQNEDSAPWDGIARDVFQGFEAAKAELEKIVLFVDSPGGSANHAYTLARLFQRRGGFSAIVPLYAKSAATLLCLGANTLIIGRDGELGPLDVQVVDVEREELGSALNGIQSLERLNAFALAAIDQSMFLLLKRTRKKVATLLPHVLSYVGSLMRPLLERIDPIDYTSKSRELKVAEEYAVRLLKPKYPPAMAKRIARQLVERYPAHGFVIDADEAESYEEFVLEPGQRETFGVGLRIERPSEEIQHVLDRLTPFLNTLTVVGRLSEVTP